MSPSSGHSSWPPFHLDALGCSLCHTRIRCTTSHWGWNPLGVQSNAVQCISLQGGTEFRAVVIELYLTELWFQMIVLYLNGRTLLDSTILLSVSDGPTACFVDWTRLGLDCTLLHSALTGLYIVDSTGIYCQQFCDSPLACNVSTSKLIEPSHNCPQTIRLAYKGIFCPSWYSYISGRN